MYLRLDVWYSDDYSRRTGRAVSAAEIRMEETKHVTDWLQRYDNIFRWAGGVERERYNSEDACRNACRSFKRAMDRYFQEGPGDVHRTNPHPY